MSRSKFQAVAALAAVALLVTASVADARAGRGGGLGSRGARTFAPPAVTQTAPRQAAPIERTLAQPAAPQRTPGAAATQASRPGFFGTGFAGGLFAGFLGAGLLGLLFGGGFLGGIGGFGSILGLVLQLALVFLLVRWFFGWLQRRNAPALAGAGGAAGPGPSPLRRVDIAPAGRSGPARSSETVSIGDADFEAFGSALIAIQEAYGREDLGELRRRVTPEMLAFFSEELADNASRGVVSRISDVRLLQGDLAEAWREGDAEYATVAMRYSLKDVTEERDSGRVVGTEPGEVTEIWTFRRSRGGAWLLSAIQQA